MILRVRFAKGRPIRRQKGKNRHVALAAGALMGPAALMAYVMGIWRLASDMGAATGFTATGLFSHWQVWIGLGVALQAGGYILNRYASHGRLEVPHFLKLFPTRPKALPRNKRASLASNH